MTIAAVDNDRSAAAIYEIARRESRTESLRVAEYNVYPRTSLAHNRRVGVTQNTSDSGMCLSVEDAEAPGTLLHVIVRDVDGSPSLDTVARVVWCRSERGERFRIGLALLATGARQALFVRHERRTDEIPVTA